MSTSSAPWPSTALWPKNKHRPRPWASAAHLTVSEKSMRRERRCPGRCSKRRRAPRKPWSSRRLCSSENLVLGACMDYSYKFLQILTRSTHVVLVVWELDSEGKVLVYSTVHKPNWRKVWSPNEGWVVRELRLLGDMPWEMVYCCIIYIYIILFMVYKLIPGSSKRPFEIGWSHLESAKRSL